MVAVVVVEKKKFASVVLNSYLNCTAVLELLCSVQLGLPQTCCVVLVALVFVQYT